MKRLSATFFATGDLALLPEEGVRAKVRECAECGFRRIVPTVAAVWGRSYAPVESLPPLDDVGIAATLHGGEAEHPFDPSDLDLFGVILDECDRLGLEFYMPTGSLSPRKEGSLLVFAYRPQDWFDDAMRELNRRFVLELAERYGHHAAFRGWYVTDEMKWSVAEHAPLVAAVARACREAKPGLPVLMSPSPVHGSKPESGLADPEQVASLDADIIAPMDLGGYTHAEFQPLDEEAWEQVAWSHRVTSEACGRAGKTYWANIECFVYNRGDAGLHGAPWQRIERQIALASEYAEDLICFEFFGLMDAPFTPWPLGRPAAQSLYADVSTHNRGFG